jgi:putative transposase
VDFENNILKLPKIGEIEAILHKIFGCELNTATISKYLTGKIAAF